jgi:hypothetical protein
MGRTRLLACVLVMVMMLVGVVRAQEAQEAQPSLGGKIVVVYLKSDPKAGAVLERVQIAALGDRHFLVGAGLDLGDPTRAGLIQWIPIDDIGRIHEFRDVNELRARTRQGG